MSLKQTVRKTAEGLGTTLEWKDMCYEALRAEAPPPASPDPDSVLTHKSTVRILIVYEDDFNRDRAQQMQEALLQRLGRSFDFSVSWWRVKFLRHPKVLQTATDAAARTDIILFSLRSDSELPQAVKNWMENDVIDNPRHRVSLLALLETGGEIAPRLSPTEIFLSHLSSKAGVDCLCYSDGLASARFTRRCEQGNDKCPASDRPTILFGIRQNGPCGSSRDKTIK